MRCIFSYATAHKEPMLSFMSVKSHFLFYCKNCKMEI